MSCAHPFGVWCQECASDLARENNEAAHDDPAG